MNEEYKDKVLESLEKANEEYKNRILESCKDMISVDPSSGFYYFWLEKGSCLGANDLRIIADELDKKNSRFEKYFFKKLSELPEPENYFEKF